MSPRNSICLAVMAALIILSFSRPAAAEDETAWPIKFYQTVISPIDGNRCPMSPTCSEYTARAFEKHGPVIGWIMTCDRLMRCGRDVEKYCPKRVINNETHYHDPVEANDFWWFKPKSQ